MRILFDQGTPVPLRRVLHPHTIDTAFENGWAKSTNGDLIQQAEDGGYQCMITTDQNLKYQQNLIERRIAILVLKTTSWPRIRSQIVRITDLLPQLKENDYLEIDFD